MRHLNADAAIAAGVIGSREPERPITVKIKDSSMPRLGGVSVRALLFPGSSLSREAALVGAFPRGHRLREVCIQFSANFFQPALVCVHLLLLAHAGSLHCFA